MISSKISKIVKQETVFFKEKRLLSDGIVQDLGI